MRALRLALLFTGLLTAFFDAHGQPGEICKEEFYLMEVKNSDSTYSHGTMLPVAGGDLMVCGATHYNNFGDGTLTRIRPDGSVVWTKTYNLSSGSGFHDMALFKDGSLAVCGSGGSIWKISSDGAVIWHRQYVYPTVEEAGSSLIDVDDQGNIYTVGFFWEGNLSFQDRIAYRKYDPDGNLLYSKMVKGGGSFTVARAQDLKVINGAAFITGYYHNYFFYSGFLMKVNTASGNLEWTRLYDFNDADLNLFNIVPSSNGLLLTGRDDINVNDTTVLLQTDINGMPVSAHYMQYNMQRDFEQFAMDADGSLYYGTATFDYVDLSVQALIGKLDLNTGIKWMKEYAIYNNNFGRMINMKVHSGSVYYSGAAFPGIYTGYSYIGRLDLEGTTACVFNDYNVNWGSANVSVRDTLLFAYDKQMTEVFSPVTTANISLDITDRCRIESKCDTLDVLKEALKLCNANDTIPIEFQKNPDCLLPVTFDFDASFIQQISTTGNTAYFKTLSDGTSKIYAIIDGSCGQLKDSIIIDRHTPPAFILGNDTAFCKGSLLLAGAMGFESYMWNTGATTQSISATEPGVYTLSVTDACGNQYSDEIVVTREDDIPVSLGADREVCAGDTLHVSAPPGFATYEWSAGTDANTIDVNSAWFQPTESMSISVTAATAEGCKSYGELYVTMIASPLLHVGNDTTVCEGREVTLNAGPGFDEYTWSNGSHNFMTTVNTGGVYAIEAVTANGCVARDTIMIITLDTPKNVLNDIYTFCRSAPQYISPNGSYSSYLWSSGDTSARIIPKTPGTYSLHVTDSNGCSSEESTIVAFEECYKGVAYPNAFTPNNDGVNDTYKPVIGMTLAKYEFVVYNRWGQVVFKTNDPNAAWDGRVNGRNQEAGNYTWRCVYQQPENKTHFDRGHVILIR